MQKIFLFIFIFFSSLFSSEDQYNIAKEYPVFEYKKFVLIIPSYNNENYIEKNLSSVLRQDYPKFRFIYINDASTDNTLHIAKKMLQESGFLNGKIIHNQENQGALANMYNAILTCEDDEIVCILDGDDSLAHDSVLSRLNIYYQNPDVWLTYGQYESYPVKAESLSKPVPINWLKNGFLRKKTWCTSHFRTFYAGLFKKIKKEDLLFRGKFFEMAPDVAMMLPMVELARDRVWYIDEILYVYNLQNPINEHKKNKSKQLFLNKYIRTLPVYPRLEHL